MITYKELKITMFIALLTLLTISSVNAVNSNFLTAADSNLPESYLSQWKITDWNESSLLYWWPKAYVNASIGSLVNFTINLPEGQATVQSDVHGTLAIGNFTDNRSNSEIARALSLSIWPWMPGLVTFPNWYNHTTEAREAANGQFMNGSLTIENTTYSTALGGTSREAITFVYQQNSGFQSTTLVYDRETGVLLYAKTKAGNFKLELLLITSDFIHVDGTETNSNDVSTPSFTLLIFLTTISSLFLVVKKKRRNK